MFSFSTSISALQANQIAIGTIANNIANANTPGYHRQQVDLSNRAGIPYQHLLIGSGVNTDTILRSFNSIVEISLSENTSRFGDVSESLAILSQVETILGPGDGSIHEQVEGFFNELQSLSLEPNNQNLRLISLQKLDGLTNELGLIARRVQTVETGIERQIESDIEQVNSSLVELIELNRRIKVAQSSGQQPNDLLDQFQQKLNSLADLVDVTAVPSDQSGYAFQFAGGSLYFESTSIEFESFEKSDGSIAIRLQGSQTEIEFTGGKLAGLQRVHNTTLTSVQNRLRQFSNEFAFQLDHIHTTGLPIGGGFNILNGVRSVSDITIPLAEATPFEQLKNGSFFITIEDSATNNRELHQIDFDPSTESLSDLVKKIDSVPGVQALITSGTLSIAAAPGLTFDFAGRLETIPDLANHSGTAGPRLAGTYSGTVNDEYRFEFIGTGTVGLTDGLRLRVTDQAGNLIDELDIGRNYEPDSLIDVKDGVKVSLGSGTINNGDFFSTQVIHESDETGVLVALGLNTLFEGSEPQNLAVLQRILDDPNQFSLSRSERSGDAANLKRLVELRDQQFLDDLTFETFVEKVNLDIAQEVNILSAERTNLEIIGQQLTQQVDAISGVDPNEEMVYLLQYQRSYEASVRVISTVDQMLSDLFSIIR